MNLYFAGAENPVYLRQLAKLGATHIAISFFEWQRRHSMDDLYKHIPEEMSVCITSGISRKQGIDFKTFANDYVEFCERNAEHSLIYDMDAMHCPMPIRADTRNQLSVLPNVVVFPFDRIELPALAKDFERLGVNSRNAKSFTIQELRRIRGTLYGSNVTDLRVLKGAKFTATTSMAWLSTRRYGELWVFARGKMAHYPAEDVPKAVWAHSRDIEALGIDPKACLADNHRALTALAVRSFQVMAQTLSKRPRDRENVDIRDISTESVSIENGIDGVVDLDTPSAENGALPVLHRDKVLLPVIGFETHDDMPFVQSNSISQRKCDSCYLSNVCPMYKPESSCAYETPIQIRSPDQWKSATQSLLEIQFGRIAFAYFAEQTEGGGISAALGREIDRFYKMLLNEKDLVAPVPGAGRGIMSQIFDGMKSPGLDEEEEDATQEEDTDPENFQEEFDETGDDYEGTASTG